MQVVYNNQVIAEANQDRLIKIEGNWYFPPDSIKTTYFKPSDERSHCFWKGEARYYDIKVGGKTNPAAAWYYPVPMAGAKEKVGKDFTNYVAFWRGVEVKER